MVSEKEAGIVRGLGQPDRCRTRGQKRGCKEGTNAAKVGSKASDDPRSQLSGLNRFKNRQSREYIESLLKQEAPYREESMYSQAQLEEEASKTSTDILDDTEIKPTKSPGGQGVETTISVPLKTEISHVAKPRIGYITRSEFENYVFLAACVRHAPNDVRLDFDAIARELEIPKETVISRLGDLKKRLTEQGRTLGNNTWTDGLAAFAGNPLS